MNKKKPDGGGGGREQWRLQIVFGDGTRVYRDGVQSQLLASLATGRSVGSRGNVNLELGETGRNDFFAMNAHLSMPAIAQKLLMTHCLPV